MLGTLLCFRYIYIYIYRTGSGCYKLDLHVFPHCPIAAKTLVYGCRKNRCEVLVATKWQLLSRRRLSKICCEAAAS
jgi:hypothetical protein